MVLFGWRNSYRRSFALWLSSASLSPVALVRAYSPSSLRSERFTEAFQWESLTQSYRCFFGIQKQQILRMSSTSSNDLSDRSKQMRVALCQFHVTEDKATNLQTCSNYIDQAVQKGMDETTKVDLIVLPEIWNSPYATSAFADYAEQLPDLLSEEDADNFDDDDEDDGADDDEQSPDQLSSDDADLSDAPSALLLQQKAMEHQIWIVGGSIPERVAGDDSKLYNTCLVFNPEGKLVAKHRKVHLFDINVPGGITFYESDTLSAGSQVTSFATPWCNIGIGICYDIRFPEYALLLAKTCQMLIYPGAFNLVTGPAHWELLQRGRAVDTQCYVLTASPARTVAEEHKGQYPPYTAWGHSTVVAPWGDVIATTDEKESIVVADIDLTKVDSMRQSIPVRNQKRTDLYVLANKAV